MRLRTLGILGGLFLAASLALGTLGTAFAQQAGPGGPGWGPGGMMGGYGGGWGMGPGMMGGWGYSAPPSNAQAITMDQAKQALENYLNWYGDSNLKLDEIIEFQYNFYAIVKEQDTGKGAMELLVDKYSGNVFPEYGPNMMWNTKYSPMGRMMGGYWGPGPNGGSPQQEPSVTSDQAKSIAQQWLDTNQPGSTTEEPDAFYGYYTVHFQKDGKVSGMLSVNGYTGQVWYHSWHGNFIAEQEEG